jgi:hypothetical protein
VVRLALFCSQSTWWTGVKGRANNSDMKPLDLLDSKFDSNHTHLTHRQKIIDIDRDFSFL